VIERDPAIHEVVARLWVQGFNVQRRRAVRPWAVRVSGGRVVVGGICGQVLRGQGVNGVLARHIGEHDALKLAGCAAAAHALRGALAVVGRQVKGIFNLVVVLRRRQRTRVYLVVARLVFGGGPVPSVKLLFGLDVFRDVVMAVHAALCKRVICIPQGFRSVF